MIHTDVAIIGAGTAGLNARREVQKAGKRALLIDPGPYGTTCARVGCMPSKLLIAAAEAAHHAAHATTFGVHVAPEHVRVDGRDVMARVRSERDRFAGFVARDLEAMGPEDLVRERAHFIDSDTLQAGPHTIRAESFVVATGSSPWIPPNLRHLGDEVLVNDDVFDLEDLPASVAVIGTGVIGLELGQSFHRLGVRTALFNITHDLGFLTDPALKATAREVLGAELDLNLGVSDLTAQRQGDAYLLTWNDEHGQPQSATFDVVLAAAGRRPNLSGLQLANAGVSLDDRGMPNIDNYTAQVDGHPIFVAGDANGAFPLLHEAADEGRIAGANAAADEPTRRMRRAPLAIAFSDPQMAIAGASARDLAGQDVVVGEVSYANQGRARVMGINKGMVRVYARRSDCTLVGAEFFAPRAEHTAHLLAWTIQQNMRVPDILRLPFYHPVLEEGIRTALRDAAAKLKVTGGCPPQDFATAPGL
jgi:dihydrolipoamide dehydrogenase